MKKLDVLGLVGPTGAGKSTIAEKVSEKLSLELIPTWTDRPRRNNEIELEHKFVTYKEFKKLEEEGFFLEVVRPFGLKYKYGFRIPKPNNRQPFILILRANYLPLLQKHFPGSRVYQIEAPIDLAKAAAQARDNSDPGTRFKKYQEEIELGRKLSDRIFVHKFNNTDSLINDICEAIRGDYSKALG